VLSCFVMIFFLFWSPVLLLRRWEQEEKEGIFVILLGFVVIWVSMMFFSLFGIGVCISLCFPGAIILLVLLCCNVSRDSRKNPTNHKTISKGEKDQCI